MEVATRQTVPNDSSFGQQWGMHNTGQTGGTADADIDAVEAWDITTGDPGFVLANIDTGVRYTHQALVSHYRGNLGGGVFGHHDPPRTATFVADHQFGAGERRDFKRAANR